MNVTDIGRMALAVSALAIAGCGPSSPPAVSFNEEVKPILDRYCLECHAAGTSGYEMSGFSVETYDDLMKGTRYGPTVIAGDPFNSNLIILIEGRADPAIKMPHDNTKIFSTHVETLKAWVDQGAANN